MSEEPQVREAPPVEEQLVKPPEGPVTLDVCCAASAGKTVSSRFGPVAFDEHGMAEITVPSIHDIALLDQLQWLLPEDRRRFLGIREKLKKHSSEEESREAMNKKMASLVAEAQALTETNVKGQEAMAILIEDKESMEKQVAALDAKIEVLTNETDKLKTLLADAAKKKKGKG